jgi:hypothetical protein
MTAETRTHILGNLIVLVTFLFWFVGDYAVDLLRLLGLG